MNGNVVAVALVVMASLAMAGAADPEGGFATIAIEANGLRPPVLRTTTDRPVRFVNRVGRPVHVQFGGVGGEHEVFQVPGNVWAVFYEAGRHPYVVHVESGTEVATLDGVVEVGDRAGRTPSLRVCSGATILIDRGEVCIER